MKKVTELVAELAAPAVAEQGCTLWDVEYVREAGQWYLRLYLDKDGGVDILDCEAVSRKVSDLLDELDPAAAACRAVNTVCFRRGLAVGYNTDAPGIRAGLLAHGADPRAGQVLIIGNGGAARAARFALGDCRLLTAARHGGDIPLDRLPQAARGSLVVINATPLGMEGFPPFASLSFLDALPPGAAVFDLVYHPRQTALLAVARDRGLTAIGGMELLVQQAILAFSRFTGTALDREAVRRDLLAMVGEK